MCGFVDERTGEMEQLSSFFCFVFLNLDLFLEEEKGISLISSRNQIPAGLPRRPRLRKNGGRGKANEERGKQRDKERERKEKKRERKKERDRETRVLLSEQRERARTLAFSFLHTETRARGRGTEPSSYQARAENQ